MSSKTSKKLAKLVVNADQVIQPKDCAKVKGGGYWCCVRNKWIN